MAENESLTHLFMRTSLYSLFLRQYTKSALLLALLASASAFAPQPARGSFMTSTRLYQQEYGKYDDKLWDGDAKKDIYAAWNPNAPRSPNNFNPFETWEGNSPDASGFFPGEVRYKDPQRPNVNFSIMMVERSEMEQRKANPKPGDVPGAPGCRNKKPAY
jgi:hypothetical protein